MCYVKPLKVKKIKDKEAEMENGIKAFYDKSVGKIRIGDKVLVYGNLIIDKVNNSKVI